MEFLKAMDEANKQGISSTDFAKIWDLETRLKLQKAEARTLELKIACAKQMEGHPHAMDDTLQQFISSQYQLLQQLKNDLVLQLQVQFQEVGKLIESQANLTGPVVRRELDIAFRQHGFSSNLQPSVTSGGLSYSNMLGDSLSIRLDQNHPSVALYGTSFPNITNNAGITALEPKAKRPRRKNKMTPMKSASNSDDSKEVDVSELEFLPPEGAELVVRDAQLMSNTGKFHVSKYFILTGFPLKARLNVWFGAQAQLFVYLSISGTEEQVLNMAHVFDCVGFIADRSTGTFSQLFEVKSNPIRRVKLTETQFKAVVCLQTAAGASKDVSYAKLESMGFIVDDSFTINWNVSSRKFLPKVVEKTEGETVEIDKT
ncbi:uncharacterized protein LOC131938563 [Physella acuta]|uniref:uncharacterized protein LOC131938563 n=1 Tax=Physella acuta TaxID=109671 RepID=UPI0027DB2280|nr:uncharacterized protein LOC131938563 [Physella acuta]